MPKILHTGHYAGTPWEILKSVVPEGFTVETLDNLTTDSLLRQVADADYLLASGRLPIDAAVLDQAKRLKMIQRTGVGTEMMDLKAIAERGIPVYVNRGVNARSVAEHALTLMLCCLKRIPQIDGHMKKGVWKKQQTGVTCHELFGKTVGLIGMGAIGRQMAVYLKAFGATVLYTDLVRLDAELESELALTFVPSFGELLPLADILSFHCPLTPENNGMLDAAAIDKMKDGAIVVNTARGKLIDDIALYDALASRKLGYAALDVHVEEPVREGYLLARLDNVILTPHIAGLTYEAFHTMMEGAIANIVAFDRGERDSIEHKKLIV